MRLVGIVQRGERHVPRSDGLVELVAMRRPVQVELRARAIITALSAGRCTGVVGGLGRGGHTSMPSSPTPEAARSSSVEATPSHGSGAGGGTVETALADRVAAAAAAAVRSWAS